MVKEEEVVLVREIDYEDVDHVLDQGQDQDQSKKSKANKQKHFFNSIIIIFDIVEDVAREIEIENVEKIKKKSANENGKDCLKSKRNI